MELNAPHSGRPPRNPHADELWPRIVLIPFISTDLTGNTGILYGVNRTANTLVIFDRFSLENYNSVTFAKSGSGKSYATKLEILRSLMFDTDVIVIDPEREYEFLSETVGGRYFNISLSSDHHINPFDLPIPREEPVMMATLPVRSNNSMRFPVSSLFAV